ncbi:MAG: hypothetical protein WA705_04175 [Candidatus Ozemobacteraceae bacterium]
MNLFRRGKQPLARFCQNLHDAFGKLSLQEFDNRVDSARAFFNDAFPAGIRKFIDRNIHGVNVRAAYQGANVPGFDLQIDH